MIAAHLVELFGTRELRPTAKAGADFVCRKSDYSNLLVDVTTVDRRQPE